MRGRNKNSKPKCRREGHSLLKRIRTWRIVKLALYVTERITTFLILFINITIKKRCHIQYITLSLYANMIDPIYLKLNDDF